MGIRPVPSFPALKSLFLSLARIFGLSPVAWPTLAGEDGLDHADIDLSSSFADEGSLAKRKFSECVAFYSYQPVVFNDRIL
jgi:hypothetical protein